MKKPVFVTVSNKETLCNFGRKPTPVKVTMKDPRKAAIALLALSAVMITLQLAQAVKSRQSVCGEKDRCRMFQSTTDNN
jgi:hypothetical protein